MKGIIAILLAILPIALLADIDKIHISGIEFAYRTPKSPSSNSRIMVLFGGRNWNGDKAIKTFNFEELADKYSLILLSPSFKDNEYWQPEKWSGKVLKSAVKLLEKKFSLKPQKLLFYGYSAGGQCANLFYNYMPNEVEAWGLHACGVYPKMPVRNGVQSFITCGLQELNIEALQFARRFFSDILEKREVLYVGEDETGAVFPISKAKEIDIEFRNYITSENLKKLWEAR